MNNWSRRFQCVVMGVSLLVGLHGTASGAESLDTLLQKGLFEEEANHNLPAAIKAYEEVVKQTDEQRKLAATAIFRLGECYRKLGKTNQAVVQYQRIVRDFAEQEQLVKLSREILTQNQLAAVTPSGGSPRFEDRLATIVGRAAPNSDPEADKVRALAAIFRDNPDRVNARDTDQRTPLHEAAWNGESRVVSFLITNGANLELRDKDSMTPLLLATRQGRKEIVEQLLQAKADPNAADQYGATPSHYAAYEASRAILLLLIKARANVDAKGSFRGVANATPLHVAASRGYRSVVELLLEADANPNARNGSGQTPLHIASTFGYDAVVELLLGRKADVNAKDNEERTALHQAAARHTTTVKLLLKAGADVNAPDKAAWTPLFHAVKERQGDIVQLLIKSGADVNAATRAGQTPLLVAVEAKDPEIAEMLLTPGADVNAHYNNGYGSLHAAIDDTTLLNTLLRFKPELEPRDSEGFTPLQRAIWNGRADAVKLLLDAGADPNNTLRSEGKTALHLSVVKNLGEITAMLLAHKADPNITDKNGQTPFDLANPSGPSTASRPPGIPPLPAGVANASAIPSRQLRQPVPGQPPQPALAEPSELRELLLKHGADTNIARRGAIAIARNDYKSHWFRKDDKVQNRFTLFELIASFYDQNFQMTGYIPFPDLSRVSIHHLTRNAASAETKLNVAALLREGDCSKDIWLNWGDIVTIPEQEHPLVSSWQGFDGAFREAIANCLKRQIFVVVKGRTNSLTLGPRIGGNVNATFQISQAQFWLSRALLGSALLLSTSDTSQIMVHRTDPITKEKLRFTFDLSRSPVLPDLWLRDGDIIEVPEKSGTTASATSNAP